MLKKARRNHSLTIGGSVNYCKYPRVFLEFGTSRRRRAGSEFSDKQILLTLCYRTGETEKILAGERAVLIIEDNPADVRLMQEALREIQPPLTLHAVTDGEEALRFLRREGEHASAPRPRLIFLDFNLPKSSSRDILGQLKEDADLRLIPVAVLTTSDAERDIRDAYGLHANCYLRKAVDLDGFLNTIRTAADFWMNIAYVASAL